MLRLRETQRFPSSLNQLGVGECFRVLSCCQGASFGLVALYKTQRANNVHAIAAQLMRFSASVTAVIYTCNSCHRTYDSAIVFGFGSLRS
mmetsp:Transcript_14520/g.27718  ORF Transcript_14520/g.27718 Transcript_14520/m.27718 type:complete len:90 (-) Transcript_14520:278-547(-)